MSETTSHLCAGHPKGKRWKDGPSQTCPYHTRLNSKSLSYREGRSFRRKRDREVGVVGRDSGMGFIDG